MGNLTKVFEAGVMAALKLLRSGKVTPAEAAKAAGAVAKAARKIAAKGR